MPPFRAKICRPEHADLRLALCRCDENAARKSEEISGRDASMSAQPVSPLPRLKATTSSWSARALPACTCCTGCAGSACGAGLRAGQWRRRHLVLEPLSRRALRRREHAVFLLVLRGIAAGVELERALRAAARDPRNTPTTSPIASTCARTSSSTPRVERAEFDERTNRWPVTIVRRQDGHRELRGARDRLPVERAHARHQGARSLQGQDLSHRPLAA